MVGPYYYRHRCCMYLDWSGEEDELRDESDYEETVLVDWLKAVAIETSQSPLFSNGKDEICILLPEYHPTGANGSARQGWVVD